MVCLRLPLFMVKSIKLEIDISLKFHVHKYNFPQKIIFLRKNEAGHVNFEVKKLLTVGML